MPTLKIKYRTFDGFERAIAAQTAHFSALRPDVGFELSHGGPRRSTPRWSSTAAQPMAATT